MMKDKQTVWIPHIMEAVPVEARKNQISMYTIALEGWRRGLKLKFYNIKEDNKFHIRYSLSNGDHIHYFNGSSGDMVTQEAFEICDSKSLTNDYLLNAGVPIPLGKKFDEELSNKEIVEASKQISFPLVVKPTNGKAGRGVIANIRTELELETSVQYVREKLGYKEILVQQYVTGEEVRVYVLNGRVLGAANRRPANVLGTGKHSIKELVRLKNDFRKQIPHLHFRPIQIDREVKLMLTELGYTLDTVPEKGQIIYLRKISNVSRGGDPIDITEQLTQKQKQTAIDATNAIPGLIHCGVDMILDENRGEAVVLELNTRPGIGSHLFPLEGKARDIPKEIIDFYFPETKQRDTSDSNIYFDFGSIQNGLKGSSTSEVEVIPCSPRRLFAKMYKITGNVEGKEYYMWLRTHALKSRISGSIRKLEEGLFELVIAGETKEAVDEFQDIWQNKRRFHISVKQERVWNHPVKLGFEWQDGYNSMSIRELEILLKEKEQETKQSLKEKQQTKHRINKMRESHSWKITYPLRYFTDGFRKIKKIR
ncbi:acylphosphatase [Oceanobacillus saliphilus]|uniref:acylphosphatase n=1 Tax=Oceanobacillus saliphilus TaxID=2925834 RepID=UPI00201E42D9|nr:acylphosphatase [Oceanobacillus saliphilus]